jgi:Tat protein secretion system quality control protein TatD with DNase activity
MSLVDTHAHLCDSVFDPDRAEVISRARAAGGVAIIAVGETLKDAQRNLELSSAIKKERLMQAVNYNFRHLYGDLNVSSNSR